MLYHLDITAMFEYLSIQKHILTIIKILSKTYLLKINLKYILPIMLIFLDENSVFTKIKDRKKTVSVSMSRILISAPIDNNGKVSSTK